MTQKINVTFLGTADQMPSKTRNHSAILLTFNDENILIDCGEGTQRQFRIAGLNPCKITKILITHWHGDHVLGLPGLLATLSASEYSKTLEIYGPTGIKEKMLKVFDAFPFHLNFEIKITEVTSGIFYEGKEFFLSVEKMEHSVQTVAYSFTKKGKRRIDKEKLKKLKISSGPLLKKLLDGKKITSDGKTFSPADLTYEEDGKKISVVMDTRNNKNILPFVENSDLFICEGTYSKELEKEASERKHMTVSQAAEIAKKANVKRLILTHLGGRHSKNRKELLDEAKKIFPETKLAKDFEEVKI